MLDLDNNNTGLISSATIVRDLDQKDVDLYAWITDTQSDCKQSGCTFGIAYVGQACDNFNWRKTSLNAGPTGSKFWGVDSDAVSRIMTAWTMSHEIGHNLGMSHDFNDDNKCRKVDDTIVECEQCNNYFNSNIPWYANIGNVNRNHYRKLSPETGNSNDCCTGVMDYQNRPGVWSTCSVRYFEQHYEAESWFQCMDINVPSTGKFRVHSK